MRHVARLSVAIIIAALLSYEAMAQRLKLSPDIRFNNYNARNHFVSDAVLSAMVSRKGYLWVAANGLYRFDGRQYVRYSALFDNPDRFKENYITDLFEDRFDRIWLAGGNGISYYDEEGDRFVYIDIDSSHKVRYAYGLCITGNKLWFTSNFGLSYLDIRTRKAYTTTLTANGDYPFNLAVDSNTIIHSGYASHYYWYHINENRSDTETLAKGKMIPIICLIKIAGRSWFGSSEGLWVVDRAGEPLRQVTGMSNFVINTLAHVPAITGDSILWIGTEKNGLLLYNIYSQEIVNTYTHDISNPFSICGNEVYSLFPDKNNTVWIGTNGGLSSVDPRSQLFKEILLPDQFPIKIVQDKYDEKVVWQSLHQKGMVKIDWPTKKATAFFPLDNITAHGTLGPGIYDMLQIDQNRWLLLGIPGLGIWNSRTGMERTITIFPLAENHRSLYLKFIIPYNKDTCFISTNGGLFLFHIPSLTIDTAMVRHSLSVYSDRDMMNGKHDGNGTLWMATRNGLVKYDVHTGNNKTYKVDESIYLGNFLSDAAVTNTGKIIFTGEGIGLLDTNTEKIDFFTRFRNVKLWGGAISIVDSIAWINSIAGIVTLNLNSFTADLTSPSVDKEYFSNFPYGKVNDEFVWLARNRYIYFRPADLAKKPLASQTIIEKVVINKKPWHHPFGTLSRSLHYNQNNINFY